jgi:hypothetical protein
MTKSETSISNEKIVGAILRSIGGEVSNDVLTSFKKGTAANAELDPSTRGHLDLLAISMPLDIYDFDVENTGIATQRFKAAYASVSLLSKATFLNVDIDKRAVAVSTWRDTEAQCRIINDYGKTFSSIGVNSPLEPIISLARKKIAKCLSQYTVNEMFDCCRFSGGASTSLSRREGHPANKYRGKPDVTPSAFKVAQAAVECDQQWWYKTILSYGSNPVDWFNIVGGSELDTVPKNSKVDRVICIEPDMNMYLQKGLGLMIRRRLKKMGVNLNSQTLNQYLAWVGSRTGSLATLDLRSASDTIALAIVQDLLPYEWFAVINTLRSAYTRIDGSYEPLEKVSSMGNGFTFELESLIFWALTEATLDYTGCCDRRLAIYGDDIVVHGSVAPLLIEVLSYVGFSTNMEKTFINGPFRESCGKHYFLGSDVTPVYIKEAISTPESLFRMCNAFAEWGLAEKTLKYLQLRLKPGYRNRVPRRYGLTAGLWEPLCDIPPPKFRRSMWIFRYSSMKVRVVSKPIKAWEDLHYALGYADGLFVDPKRTTGAAYSRETGSTSSWD